MRQSLTYLAIPVFSLLLLGGYALSSYAENGWTAHPLPETVSFLEIRIMPFIVRINEAFLIEATVVNNTPDTITYHGDCDSPISVEFDGNVGIEYEESCQPFSIIELKPGEKATVYAPSSGLVYRAIAAGQVNANVKFSYEVNGERKTISELFKFTIEDFEGKLLHDFDLTFKLAFNETAISEVDNIRIKFLKVLQDSRCPNGAVCIWQGQAVIQVSVTRNNVHFGNFNLTTTGSYGSADSVAIDGYFLRLLKLEPYPSLNDPIKLSEYVATFFVDKSEDMNSVKVYVKAVNGIFEGDERTYNVIGTWNLQKNKGKIITFSDIGRGVYHLKLNVANCRDLVKNESAECIFSPVIVDSGSLPMSMHIGLDKKNMQFAIHFISKSSDKIIFDIKELKTWSENGIVSIKSISTLHEGQRDGPLLVQKIYSDRVEGLNFIEYPIAREQGAPVTLRIGETASNGCAIMLTLVEIRDNTAIFIRTLDMNKPCPIC